MKCRNLFIALLLASSLSVTVAGPIAYLACQIGCHATLAACVGTAVGATAGAAAPAASWGCNILFGKPPGDHVGKSRTLIIKYLVLGTCMGGCASLFVAPTP